MNSPMEYKKSRKGQKRNSCDGELSSAKRHFSKPLKQAYQSWVDQRQRCYNKTCPSFKYYGAKGIEVKYSSVDFCNWWIEELKKFNGKKPTISRIDHDGHYEFGNIKMEDHRKNCVEDALSRCWKMESTRKIPVKAHWMENGRFYGEFQSVTEASIWTGAARPNIIKVCKGKAKHAKGFIFAYIESTV